MVNALESFCRAKAESRPLVTLTAYDYPTAKLLDEVGIDLILVGDSLGMVVLGYEDTTFVTIEDMLHHVRPVARAVTHALVVADLPFGSASTPELALDHSKKLIEAGAAAVKLEGGKSMVPQIAAIVEAGIPVVAHIGMLPQRVREEGGYRIKGRTEQQSRDLLEDALAIEKAGAIGIVLELVAPAAAELITRSIKIPTIGIGSGRDCDGQILVTHDLIGFFPWFTPRFVQARANVAAEIRRAVSEYASEIRGIRH